MSEEWNNYWKRDRTYNMENDPLYNEVLETLPKNKSSMILEAGCGDGKWINKFYELGYKNLIGLDFSYNGLLKIRQKNKKTFLIKADIRNLPIKDCKFDNVFSFGVIEHFKKNRPLVDEMYRVTKKHGIIFLDTPNTLSLHTMYRFYRRIRGTWVVGYEDSYTTGQLKRILKRSGFSVITSGTRGHYNKFDIFGFLSFVVAKKV